MFILFCFICSLLNACILYVMLEYAIMQLYGFLNKVNLESCSRDLGKMSWNES